MAFIAATRRDHKIGPVHDGEDAEQLGEAGSGTINVQLGSHSHHNHQCQSLFIIIIIFVLI